MGIVASLAAIPIGEDIIRWGGRETMYNIIATLD